jgi:TnpA family transposase
MKQNWSEEELNEEWHISSQELILIKKKSNKNHLIFAVKLKFFEKYGYIPKSAKDIPIIVINHIASQIGVGTEFLEHNSNRRTSREHNNTIRKYFEFSVMGKKEIQNLKKWLWEFQFPFKDSHSQLITATYKYLYDLRLEPPSNKQMEKLLKSWSYKFESEFFDKVAKELCIEDKVILDNLLAEENSVGITLNDLKPDPGKASVKTIEKEMNRLKYIQETSILSSDFFQKLSPTLVKKYHNYVMSLSPSQLEAFAETRPNKKYSLLACFCYARGTKFIDNLIDILLRLIHKIFLKGKNKAMVEFWNNRKIIYNKDKVLRDIAVISVENPEGIIEEKIYPEIGKEILDHIASNPISFDEYYTKRRYYYMSLSYKNHYRRVLNLILNNLVLSSNNAKNNNILKAIKFVQKYLDSKIIYYPFEENIPNIIPRGVKKIVIENDKVNKIKYELVLLRVLSIRLRCKEIWVIGAAKYRNPDNDLPIAFEDNKVEYYKSLNMPQNSEEFVIKLKEKLSYYLSKLNKNLPKNKKVTIIKRKSKAWIKVTPLKAQKEPDNIDKLKQEISERWPGISLLDVLKEVELRLDLTSTFESIASKEVMSKQELQHKILLCIFALATNTGLKRISSTVPGITYEDLKYIQRRFINQDNLRNTIIKVINSNLEIRNKSLFGGVTISCACDSTKFNAWDQNLMTEWHARYKGPGIMVYWHVDKKALCVYSQLKSCSSSEIVSMIEGIIYHSTNAEISKSYVDSHGQSLIAFAFSNLLNFSLLPRLKGIGSEKLYLPNTHFTEIENIQKIVNRTINWNIITENYDQMIQYATALKLKISDPESLLKRFTANNLQHPVYQALQELGRVIKTIFICQYLCFEELRQEIHEGLNVIERWNSVNDFIFYGKKSVISSNEQTGRELSILALHLLQSSLVYINTLMIQKILDLEHWKNKLTIEDKRALSPLFYSHVNPYGTFKLDMNKRIVI